MNAEEEEEMTVDEVIDVSVMLRLYVMLAANHTGATSKPDRAARRTAGVRYRAAVSLVMSTSSTSIAGVVEGHRRRRAASARARSGMI